MNDPAKARGWTKMKLPSTPQACLECAQLAAALVSANLAEQETSIRLAPFAT